MRGPRDAVTARGAGALRWPVVLVVLLVLAVGCSALQPPQAADVQDPLVVVPAPSASPPVVAPVPPDVPTVGRWQPATPPPLSARIDPAIAWSGDEVIVVGGRDPRCPAVGSCPRRGLTDGAAYEPETDTWRPIADLPLPVPGSRATTTTGGILVGTADRGLWRYTAREDDWTRLPVAPGGLDGLAVQGDRIVAYALTQQVIGPADHLYDPFRREWLPLPADPHAPMAERQMAWLGRSLVLTGTPIDPEASQPIATRAARLDDVRDDDADWQVLPPGAVQPGTDWVATDRGLVRLAAPDDAPQAQDHMPAGAAPPAEPVQATGPHAGAAASEGDVAIGGLASEGGGVLSAGVTASPASSVAPPGAAPARPAVVPQPGGVLRLDPTAWYRLPAALQEVPDTTADLSVPPTASGRTVVGGAWALDLHGGTWAAITADPLIPHDPTVVWGGDRLLAWAGWGPGGTAAVWLPPWADAPRVPAPDRRPLAPLPPPTPVEPGPPPGPDGRPDGRIDCQDESRTRLTGTYPAWSDGEATPQQALEGYLGRQARYLDGEVVIVDRIHAAVVLDGREVVVATARQLLETRGWVPALMTACGHVDLIIE